MEKMDTTTGSTSSCSLLEMNSLVDRLVDQVRNTTNTKDNSNSNSNNMSLLLLELKSHHRSLLDQVTALQASQALLLQKQQERLRSQTRALVCQRRELQRQIRNAKSFETPHLKQLAEQEPELQAVLWNTSGDGDDNDPALVNQFLHQEIHLRATLEQECTNMKSTLQEKMIQLHSKRRFLESLPEHLQAMERASLPLQKLVHKNSDDSSNRTSRSRTIHIQSTTRIGSERYERLVLAKSLPSCLYTLFHQLQHYIDNSSSSSSSSLQMTLAVEETTSTVAAAAATADKNKTHHVVLTLPIPDVVNYTTTTAGSPSTKGGANKNKRVCLQFHATVVASNDGGREEEEDGDDDDDDEQEDKDDADQDQQQPFMVVTVFATGGALALYQDVFLQELFPHDTGIDLNIGNTTTITTTGRSFKWCNYMGGLHLASIGGGSGAAADGTTTNSSTIDHSTRVILRELQRRVRANATLKHILYSLQQQRKLPALPSILLQAADGGIIDEDDTNDADNDVDALLLSSCQVVSVVQEKADRNNNNNSIAETTFTVTLRHNNKTAGMMTLTVQVRVHMARYPAVPPVWTLQPSTTTSTGIDDNSDHQNLYHSRLAALEHYVNVQLLLQEPPAQKQQQQKLYNDVRAEWILVVQLREIIKEWINWNNTNNNIDTMTGTVAVPSSSAAARNKRKRRST